MMIVVEKNSFVFVDCLVGFGDEFDNDVLSTSQHGTFTRAADEKLK
jgi:hypothetical protein